METRAVFSSPGQPTNDVIVSKVGYLANYLCEAIHQFPILRWISAGRRGGLSVGDDGRQPIPGAD